MQINSQGKKINKFTNEWKRNNIALIVMIVTINAGEGREDNTMELIFHKCLNANSGQAFSHGFSVQRSKI